MEMRNTGNKKEEILNVHNFRFTCKEFNLNRKVSEEDIKFLLEIGRLSPSSFGFEPWKFVVVENEELKEKLFPLALGAEKQISTSSHLVIMLARKDPDIIYSSDYINYMMKDVYNIPEDKISQRRERYRVFQKENFNLLNYKGSMFQWAVKQTYIPLGNVLTAAAEIGIDSCAIEEFNRKDLEVLLEKEGILDSQKFGVSCLIAFGYRAEEPYKEKVRRPIKDVVEWIR